MFAREDARYLEPARFTESFPPRLYGGAIGLLASMAIASLFIAGPQIEVDEGSYLLSAATLLGKLVTSGVNSYYSGYSLLLLPAFLAGPDPTRIYHAVLLINALAVATTPFALFRLTRLLSPIIESKWHASAAIAATSYAPLLLISQHAMSESALVPLYAWLLATGAEAALTARRLPALLCGLIAGFLFLVHPRGGLMAAAVLGALSVVCLGRAGFRSALVTMWIAALCIALLHGPLENLAGKPGALGSAYDADSLLPRLLRPSTWPWIGLNTFGALTEAIVSSLGIVAIGLAALFTIARNGRWTTPPAGIIAAIAIGFAVALLMSATFFIPPARADQIAYGRYALPATIPLVALGLLRFTTDLRPRRNDALLAVTVGLAFIVVMGIVFPHLPPAMTTTWNFINAPILHIAPHITRFLEHTQNVWWQIGACFVVASGLLYAAVMASRTAGIVAYVVLNLSLAAFCWTKVTWRGADVDAARRNVVAASNAFESVTATPLCAKFSPELQGDVWFAIDMRWRMLNSLPDTRRSDARPCATASVETLKRSEIGDVDRLIAIERRVPLMQDSIGLFVERGAALATWRQRMPPVPPEVLAPLPAGERRADIDLHSVSALPLRIGTGDVLALDVRVANAGATSTWPTTDVGPYPIQLGARSFIGDSADAVGEYRAMFGTPLAPGESEMVHIDVGPFPRAGAYRVSVGVVQEFVAWFPDAKDFIVQVGDR